MNYTTSTVDGENDRYEGIKTYTVWDQEKRSMILICPSGTISAAKSLRELGDYKLYLWHHSKVSRLRGWTAGQIRKEKASNETKQNINLHGSLTFIQTTADGCWETALHRDRWHATWVSKEDTVNMWHKQAWRELLNMKACPFSFWPLAFINKRLLLALPSEFISAAGSRPSAAHAWPRSDGRTPSWQMLTASSRREKHKLASNKTWWKKPDRPTGRTRGI